MKSTIQNPRPLTARFETIRYQVDTKIETDDRCIRRGSQKNQGEQIFIQRSPLAINEGEE
jgi:hypothetical protein